MRPVSILLLTIVGLFSCSADESPSLNTMPQTWVFSGTASSWVADPQITPIVDSLYYYQLREDGTFTKFIGEYELEGTYEMSDDHTNDAKYLTFHYDQATYLEDRERDGFGLIHYCGQDYEPFVFIDSNTIKGSWGACDGPHMYFERK